MSSRAHIEVKDKDKDGDFRVFGRITDRSFVENHDVSAGPRWPEELEQRCPDWTEAFKGLPLHDTVGKPSRLVHMQTSKDMHPVQSVQYTVMRPQQPVRYAAVSYAWAQWKTVDDMLCRLKGLMKASGLEYCWIDQQCIDQNSEADKAAEIRRMGNYYAQAAITYVMVPEWSVTFTWELDGFCMSHWQAARAVEEVGNLEKTKWARRVWTLQEASLSGRTVFVGRNVIKSAAELAVACELDGLTHAVWYRGEDGESYVRAEFENAHGGASSPVIATQILRDKVILTNTEDAKTEYEYLDDVWRLSGERKCSKVEDRVYGMLGLVRHGYAVTAEYGIGFEEAVRRAAAAGLVSSRILMANINSQIPGRSWCPAPGTESWSEDTQRRWGDKKSQMYPIQLTTEGLCIVSAVRFRMPMPDGNRKILKCKFWDGERDFDLAFMTEIPEDEERRGDWLALLEPGDSDLILPDGRHSRPVTLIKYETTEEKRVKKLRALEVLMLSQEEVHVEKYILG
jgi:hypothetical protein